VQLPVLPVDQVDGVLDDRQRLEAEKVELHQTRRFHPFHVELGRRHVRARVAVKRHQLIKRAVPDHDTGGMGGGIPQKPLDLARVIHQALDRVLAAFAAVLLRLDHLGADAFFLRDGLLDGDGFDAFTGIILESLSTCPNGICSTRPTSRTAALDRSAPKVMICPPGRGRISPARSG
jgi:hypothetical protein